MNLLKVLGLILAATISTKSQSEKPFICGTEHLEDIKQEMLRNRETFKGTVFLRNVLNYIPVKIHMVAYDDGSRPIAVLSVLKMMCSLNTAYADQNFQFYIKDMVVLNNTTITEMPQSSGGALQMSLNKDSKAINIFVVNKINKDGVAGYYQGPAGSSNDFIVIQKDYISDVRVAPHEVGHYLSLPHTFHGWDSDPWDATKHGNPVTSLFAPDGLTLNELADSSNCGVKNVGDGFCDTPADYNFGTNSCSFSLVVKDRIGNTLAPQTNNFMNYFFGCNGYIFTPNQKDAVVNSYNSTGRRDIRGTSPLNATVIKNAAVLIKPVGGQNTVSADSVELDWNDVEGATRYLVQYDVVSTFELQVVSTITKESKWTIRNLIPGRTYHWRVIPFNDYSTCYPDPSRTTFKAGGATATPDIPEVKSFLVAPNPIQENKQLSIYLETKTSFNGTLSIYDVRGSRIQFQSKERFQSGLTTKTFDLSGLSAGVYMVTLTSEKGVANRKIVVY